MSERLSSRERMLEALACHEADHVPCCFMIFGALASRCKSPFEFVERQLEMGLDATVGLLSEWKLPSRVESDQGDLSGLPVRYAPEVEIRDWREDRPGEPYPLLHREYITPAGTLHTSVVKTEDWVQGDRVPLFDDFVIPRAHKRLVTRREDLEPLRYLLLPPSDADIERLRESAAVAHAFAQAHGVLVQAGWGSVADTACWLAGMTDLVLLALDDPDLVQDLFHLIEQWNRRRMEVMLDAGVDLLIRRAWYASSDLWSPALYRRFILPTLQRDADLAHQAGAKLGYIMTTGQIPLLDQLLESGIDVLIGVDPVQGKGMDLAAIKAKLGGKVCLWGGVNGFVTVERGTEDEVKAEVQAALKALAPGGGFILSPVDNVTANTDRAWANVKTLIEEWQRGREYPMQ